MSHTLSKRTFEHVHPTKIQISLWIRALWSESSLGVIWTDKDANFLHADIKDSDLTVRTRRPISVFVGCISQNVRFLTLWYQVASWSAPQYMEENKLLLLEINYYSKHYNLFLILSSNPAFFFALLIVFWYKIFVTIQIGFK